MSKNFVDILKASCIRLAHSVVINHPYVGRVINERLQIEDETFRKFTNVNDKSTWKYYLNMSGQYHPTDMLKIHRINKERKLGIGLDQSKMIINIAGDDGPVEIEFTKENITGINADENIALNYKIDSDSYNALLSRYPEYESLIKGILHPIPLEISTNADDFSVLYCGGYYRTRLNTLRSEFAFIKGSSLVYQEMSGIEDWELTIVDDVEKFTKTFFKQHDNKTYAEFNDLYFASSIGLYYLNLPVELFNIRLDKVKSLETHSLHVQMYLDSYLGLGQYLSYLTRTQQMYLYRNIEWLSCNAGKQKVFDELVEYFLKDRGIAVIVYDGLHDTDKLGIDDESDPVYIREYKDGLKLINTKVKYTVEELIKLEKDCARDNGENVEDQVDRVALSTLLSTSSKFKTKVIETQLNNLQNNPQYLSKEEFLFNNWIYSSWNGEYTGLVNIGFPDWGKKIQLTVRNASLLFFYCYYVGYLNVNTDSIPTMLLHHIPKTHSKISSIEDLINSWNVLHEDEIEIPRITKNHLTSWLLEEENGDEFSSLEMMKQVSSNDVSNEELNLLFSKSPVNRRYYSVAQFSQAMEINWKNYLARNYVAHGNRSIQGSAEIKNLIERLYKVEKLDIPINGTLGNWVRTLGVNIVNMTREDHRGLCNVIFREVLGIDDEDLETLKIIHKALINIVKVFTSYNIQWITNTASGEVSNMGVNYFRMDHIFTGYISDNDVHICKYPDYVSIQNSSQSCTKYFGYACKSFNKFSTLLSQEQLQFLVTTEENEGILLGGNYQGYSPFTSNPEEP